MISSTSITEMIYRGFCIGFFRQVVFKTQVSLCHKHAINNWQLGASISTAFGSSREWSKHDSFAFVMSLLSGEFLK